MKNNNKEIAKIFNEISGFLAMDKVPFKPFAYEKAAVVLASLNEDVSQIYQQGGIKALEELPGVGESMAKKIVEYLKTGKIKYYQGLKKMTPINLAEISEVEGLGPKKTKILYEKLGIRNLKELESAAKKGKIAPLFGFGEKTEKNILEGIAFTKRAKGRFLLGEIFPMVREIEERLASLGEVEKISVAGSIRRKKETIGDVDFLVVTKAPEKVMDFFVSLPGVVKVWGKGKTKSSVRLEEGFDVDLRVVPPKSYGAALQYFTGSKEHNIATRKIAIFKNLKLSEYGLFTKGNKIIAGRNEEEVYQALEMDWIPPELRENQGEIEAALKHQLPHLVEQKEIKGDLHCHSDWDGGGNTISEMAEKAVSLGYQYLGISDHTKFLRIENGLGEEELAGQRKEIEKINKRFQDANLDFQLLQGCEANILKDGSFDIKDSALAKLDYVIGGIHSSLKMAQKEMTERMIKAMKNPVLKIISHPSGRILKKRDEYEVDFEKILRAAKEFKVILEINSSPVRLDLNDKKIKIAKERGVKMAINTDAHSREQLELMEFGLYQARRGWAEKKDILNCEGIKDLRKSLK